MFSVLNFLGVLFTKSVDFSQTYSKDKNVDISDTHSMCIQ